MANIVQDSFVVVSDFHATEYPIKKIKEYYLNEYQYIYILGDITDRGADGKGSGGIKMLIEIMELSKSTGGRIIYIPGNHDQFVYNYGIENDKIAYMNLINNGGENTVNELNTLRTYDPQKFRELMSWLGSQPLQRVHTFKNQKYALAHAFFNKPVYDYDSSISLSDMLKCDANTKEVLNNILWYRKGDDYLPQYVPSGDYIEVIGHTPEKYRQGENLDLTNGYQKVKVICVDGGIAYSGSMYKYDGGKSEIKTIAHFHQDTSPKTIDNELLKNTIIQALFSCPLDYFVENFDVIIMKLGYKGATNYMSNLSKSEIRKYIVNCGLDYIIQNMCKKFDYDFEAVGNQFKSWINENDCNYITYSEGYARLVAKNIGVKNLTDTFSINEIYSRIYQIINQDFSR